MTDTVNLGLPCIEGSQAQKHVTHNDALRILDTLVQLAVLDRDLTAPPSSPSEGQRWIVKATGTGAWAGHNNAIAAWQDGAWQFSVPQTGWCAYVADEGTLLLWNGTAWGDFFSTVTSIQNLALLGVGTTADTTNRLSAKLNNTLFVAKTVAEGGDGNLRYKLSKESSSKTLSFLLQDNYSGRAEIGLTGDDDFHFKVSPDGSTWTEGLRIAAATGKVSFPVSGGPREVLTANRTYYVRTDGNDSNNGLANTSGGAFLTIAKALSAIWMLDLGGFAVTVQVTGNFTENVTVDRPFLGGSVTLAGDTTTPSNVTWTGTTACLTVTNTGVALSYQGFKFLSSSVGIVVGSGASVSQTGLCEYGAITAIGIQVNNNANFNLTSNMTIFGSTPKFLVANEGASIRLIGSRTITLSGSPVFSTAFVQAQIGGIIRADSLSFSGSTGASSVRYDLKAGGMIFTNGGGANFFAGTSAGTNDGTGVYN